ncbi:MAG: DNA polymerase III delta' subunit HolB [Idiomarinaceae bacterium HL-53]|nr:MAG: DNA polymerase III delta' subunit HolB [Idiomarinaceae bacterium HL-53]CUS48950.1 DNA polymerase-3 subunit delta' [Idiomarinaceae bacterium HL-53]
MASVTTPWLRPLWQQWALAKQNQGLPHAMGIPWQPDAGTELLLDALIAWLLCNSQGNKACGVCKSCLLQQAGNHPDFLRVVPEENKKIGVDEIRSMNARVWSHANQAGAKVVLVQSAERMTEAAANALLKTLEEPPQNTYFIIAPERFARVLPTIRSRVQIYTLPTPSEEEIKQWLQEHLGWIPEDPYLISRAQFAPLKVLNTLESKEPQASLVDLILAHEPLPYPEKGVDAERWLDDLLNDLQRRLATTYLENNLQFANKLIAWYDHALQIKRQFQLGGLNLPTQLEKLFAEMRRG